MADAIVVQELSKRFRRYREQRAMTFEETLLHGGWRRRPVEYLWALRRVSFRVAPGRMVGIVGPNGAGKSTLLRLIGGVGRPDQGQVAANGRIGSLLDLGVGFHPDLSGRENVFIDGVIAGLTRREVARRIDAIVAFAELEEFLDSPLRTYSTGMQMRLAFAVAAHTDPEILLVDEILAVGDLAFQRKCMDRIAQFRADGCTIVLVSHDANAIRQMCDEVLWLRRGEIVAYGPASVVVDQYVAEMSAETRRRTPITHPVTRTTTGAELQVKQNRFGSLEMEIIAVRLCDRTGMPIAELGSGDMLRVEMEYHAPTPIYAPIFGVTISREDGTICYDTSTETAGAVADRLEGTGTVSLTIDRLDLAGGEYYVDVGVYADQWAYAYDYHWHVYPLAVRAPRWGKGILQPPSHWRLDR